MGKAFVVNCKIWKSFMHQYLLHILWRTMVYIYNKTEVCNKWMYWVFGAASRTLILKIWQLFITMYGKIHSTHIRASCIGSNTFIYSVVIGNHTIDNQITIRCNRQPWDIIYSDLTCVEVPCDHRVGEPWCDTSQYQRLALHPNYLRIWNYHNWNYYKKKYRIT